MQTGVDIVEINRFDRIIESNHYDRFIKKIFNPQEIESKIINNRFLAKRFAAKEAVAKSLGCGFYSNYGVSFLDINVLNGKLGQPFVKLSGKAHAIALDMFGEDYSSSLSISDSCYYAVASFVIYSKS